MLKPRFKRQEKEIGALPLEQNFAKTCVSADGEIVLGQTVFQHCRNVGLVAQAISEYLPETLRERWLPSPAIAAALHDVGKASPTFQEKLRRATAGYIPGSVPELAQADPSIEMQWGGHAGVSYLTVRDHPQGSESLAQVEGAHHGYLQNAGLFRDGLPIFGGLPWKDCRYRLCEELTRSLGQNWPQIGDSLQMRLLAGLTSVADWIGSGGTLSRMSDPTIEDVRDVVRRCGFKPAIFKNGLTFKGIFGFTPNATQEAFAQSVRGPGVYVLEAEMGAGKTEAALYAAYLALSRGEATGFYFALPTQATSDSIHGRVQAFLKAVTDEEVGVKLVHSNAFFSEMGAAAGPSGDFFSPTKRRILYPYDVGTIDQALMAVMNVKHGFVRTFGLLGKVVILDEVHSYDLYTGSLMDELVSTIRTMGGTVILLSATLTRERRRTLVNAAVQSEEYPLLTSVYDDAPDVVHERSIAVSRHKSVDIVHCRDEHSAFAEALKRARGGEQVLWIENTVLNAQNAYRVFDRALAQDPGTVEIGLLHSRFTRDDRHRLETHWIGLYGRKARTVKAACGRILIGTQVLEQSLDLDADFLVTRFCPTDLMLQRLGRLWRHPGSVRVEQAQCRAWILEPDLEESLTDPQKALGSTGGVYVPYVLIKSLMALKDRAGIRLPDDIRPLIEDTYETQDQRAELKLLRDQMIHGYTFKNIRHRGTEEMRALARLTQSESLCQPDDESCTRLIDAPSVDVLVLRDFDKKEMTLWDGTTVSLPVAPENRIKTALDLRRNTVSVPRYMAPELADEELLTALSQVIHISKDESARLRVILGQDRQEQAVASYHYNEKLGYSPKPD